MQKFSFVFFVALFSIAMASCFKSKDYTCKCTYVHHTDLLDTIPKADIVEESTVKGRLAEQAQSECDFLDDKYFQNNYNGTCLIK